MFDFNEGAHHVCIETTFEEMLPRFYNLNYILVDEFWYFQTYMSHLIQIQVVEENLEDLTTTHGR